MTSDRPGAAPPAPALHADLVLLADVTWARWGPLTVETPEGQPWRRHRRVVESLLVAGPDGAGAALRHTPERGAPAGWVAAGTAATDSTLDTLVDGLAAACRAHERREATPEETEAALGRFAHRVHLPVGALERILGQPRADGPGIDAQACADFRFRHHLGSYWLYVTLWLSSSRPDSAGLAPAREDSPAAAPLAVDRLAGLHDRFRALSDAFREHLLSELVPIGSTVLDEGGRAPSRRYRAPRFWIAVRTGGAQPVTGCPVTDRLCRTALGVPGPESAAVATDTLVARADLPGDPAPLVVLRSMSPQPGGPVPAYLVLPGAAASRAAREDAADRLVEALTRVEGSMAAHLLDVTTELDIDHAYGRLHAALARKGALLWDVLALDLPLRQGRELDHLHRLIELVHLALLQGLADLQQLQSSAGRTVAELDVVPDEALDRLDTEYLSLGAAAEPGTLGESLRSGGYVAPTRRWATAVARSTDDVAAQVTGLLDAISHAFDERRVRDTDRIGRAGLLLAIGLGTVGFVTETYGGLLGEVAKSWNVGGFLLLLAGVLVLVLTTFDLARRWWRRRNGDLAATRRFQRLYTRVRDYAVVCRGEKLEAARQRAWAVATLGTGGEDLRQLYRSYHDYWDDTDRHLAGQFAGIVDELRSTEARNRRTDVDDVQARVEQQWSGPPDLDGLRARVEQWVLVALLVAERPRSFYAYPLPRLTLLCRFFPVLSQGIELADPTRPAPALVSDADLQLTLRVHCAAELAHLPTLTAWGASLARAAERGTMTATAMLAAIDGTGLRAGMDRTEWNAAHTRIADALGGRD